MRENFSKLYCEGKARSGMTEEEVADALGMTRTTLRKRRQNPGSFSLGDVLKLCILFCMEEEEAMKIIGLYCVKAGD